MLPTVSARTRAWTSDEAEGRATELLQSGAIGGFGMRVVRHLMSEAASSRAGDRNESA